MAEARGLRAAKALSSVIAAPLDRGWEGAPRRSSVAPARRPARRRIPRTHARVAPSPHRLPGQAFDRPSSGCSPYAPNPKTPDSWPLALPFEHLPSCPYDSFWLPCKIMECSNLSDELSLTRDHDHGQPVMLTGSQIRHLRLWAGIATQAELGRRAGVSLSTIRRAEECGDGYPEHLATGSLLAIARVFEEAGAVFELAEPGKVSAGVVVRLPSKPTPLSAFDSLP